MSYLLCIAFTLQMFSFVDGVGAILQSSSLLPLAILALHSIYSGKVTIRPSTNVFLIFSSIITLQSLLVTFFHGKSELFSYSLIYGLVVFSVFCISHMDLDEVINSYLLSILIFVAAVLTLDTDGIVSAATAGSNIGAYRLSSFGVHPNLLGHIFSMGILLSVYKISASSFLRDKLINSVPIFLFTPLLIFTSSRGAILSLAVALACWTLYLLVKYRKAKVLYFISFSLPVVAYFVFSNFLFLAEMLDLNSEYRGIGTDFSGRGGNWLGVVSIVINDPFILMFGHGFRSWDDLFYGFATDSSYINFIYEFGIFTTIVLILGICFLLWSIVHYEFGRFASFFLLIFVFSIVEGFIARYLIAIGNPASLMIIFAAIYFFNSVRQVRFNGFNKD